MTELQNRLIEALVHSLTDDDPVLEIQVGEDEIRVGWKAGE